MKWSPYQVACFQTNSLALWLDFGKLSTAFGYLIYYNLFLDLFTFDRAEMFKKRDQ
jgi:hypothetical protein